MAEQRLANTLHIEINTDKEDGEKQTVDEAPNVSISTDTPKSTEGVIKSTEDVLNSTDDALKSTNDVTKSSDDALKSTNDVKKSTDNVMKSSHDVWKSTDADISMKEASSTDNTESNDITETLKTVSSNEAESTETAQSTDCLLDEPIPELSVKCEIIELSDEDVMLTDDDPNDKSAKGKKCQSAMPESSEFVCDKCSKHFLGKRQLRRHKVIHREDRPRWMCDKCCKDFPDRCQLKRHSIVHTDVRPHICSKCGQRYRQAQHLRMHEKVVHMGIVESFPCTECGATFNRKSTLKTHEKIHSGIKPYSCHICPSKFVQKWNLVYHIKMHQGEKEFECKECNKRFMTRSKMNQHAARHLKVKNKLKKRVVVKAPEEDIDANSTSPIWGSEMTEDQSVESILS